MTAQELQEIMSQQFEAQDKLIAQRFEALENRQDRLEARMDPIETKLDRVLELVAVQHGERASTVPFGNGPRGLPQLLLLLLRLSRVFSSNQQARKG